MAQNAPTSKIPPVPRTLVDYLARVYPDRCPDPMMTDREIWMAAGKAHVVRVLRSACDEQHNNLEIT